jgi:hypothetical protein
MDIMVASAPYENLQKGQCYGLFRCSISATLSLKDFAIINHLLGDAKLMLSLAHSHYMLII